MQSKIRLCCIWSLQKVLVTGDCWVFIYHWWPPVCDAKMVVAHVQKVPQSGLVTVARVISQCLGTELMEVELRRYAHGQSGQFPAQI